jgi:hypothetical protein
LILPQHFKAGSAWGEWGPDEIKALIGYIPKGLERLASLWSAPIADYAFKGLKSGSLKTLSLSYIASAIIGVVITIGLVFLIGKFLSKKE